MAVSGTKCTDCKEPESAELWDGLDVGHYREGAPRNGI